LDINAWVQTSSLRLKVEEKEFVAEHVRKLVPPAWNGHLKITVEGTDRGCVVELRGPSYQLRNHNVFASWSGIL
jgi:hypothetical protein